MPESTPTSTTLPAAVLVRWRSHVDASAGPDACWPWSGPLQSAGGYGEFVADGVKYRAHRLAVEIHQGPIPDGLEVLHGCDNPPCCNPAHLRVGTQAENIADAIARGRHRPPPVHSGVEQHSAKLDVSKVREIRRRAAAGEAVRALAREFEVDPKAVRLAVQRRTWKDVA